MTIGDDFYDPTSVRIAVGGTVEFRNTGGDEHSATSSAFDTGVLGGGASARKTFPSAGTFAFLCIFHSDMRGTIEVVAPSGGDGGTEPVAPQPTPTPTPSAVPAPAAEPTPKLVGAPAEVSVDAADFAFRPRRSRSQPGAGSRGRIGRGPAFGHGEGRRVRQRDARERSHVRADLRDARVVCLPLCVPPRDDRDRAGRRGHIGERRGRREGPGGGTAGGAAPTDAAAPAGGRHRPMRHLRRRRRPPPRSRRRASRRRTCRAWPASCSR